MIWRLAICVLLPAALLLVSRSDSVGLPAWAWQAKGTNARFTGQRGTFAQFGDSITVTQAFWAPLAQGVKNAPPSAESALDIVKRHMRPECWSQWKGPEFGSEGGKTVAWANENVDSWLRKLNPEVAVVLFGSNDLSSVEPAAYQEALKRLARRCTDNGTVVILTTIPPRHGFEEKSARFADATRQVAADLRLPLIDYHAEIMKRRPDDWNGALDRFKSYDDYEVPTLISRDGVHPSWPMRFQNDFSEESLRSSGYNLRNYLTLLKYAEVIETIQAGGPPVKPWHPRARPLPPPKGTVIRVSSPSELFAAAERVEEGGTILLADGTYPLSRRLGIRKNGVALRGASGNRDRVILDGGGTLGEAVAVTAASDVVIADLTVQNVRWNGIKIDSETGVHRLRIYNCVLHNIWQRAVKGVMVPERDRERIRPRDMRIEYCLFYNDRPKQFSDDPADTPQNFGGDYVGGIDAMYPTGWQIADNVFVGIQGRRRQARGAVFLWVDARDCLVERNIIVDCDSGICIGNSHKEPTTEVHATRCIVRNNMITRAPENGILADFTRDCQILHNTVYDPNSRLGRGIRIVHENGGLVAANNLLAGVRLLNETGPGPLLERNQEITAAFPFVDSVEGNLRLRLPASGIIDSGKLMTQAAQDIDRRLRGPRADLGAHELSGD